MKNYLFRFRIFGILCFAFLSLVLPLSAHEVHKSLTLIDFNQDSKSIEISIKLFQEDLIQALPKQNGKEINLEKTKDIDAILLKFISNNLIIKNQENKVKEYKWVGKEMAGDSIWIYLESEMPEGLENSLIRNQMFFDIFPKQENFVNCNFNGKKVNLVIKLADRLKEFLLN